MVSDALKHHKIEGFEEPLSVDIDDAELQLDVADRYELREQFRNNKHISTVCFNINSLKLKNLATSLFNEMDQ